MAWLVKLINKVLPSGADLATASAAMLPPAPGRFSTTTTLPNKRPSSTDKARASVSVEPPAGAPTKTRTGCACALPAKGKAMAEAATADWVIKIRRVFMALSLLVIY
jgi:hypothetical protein